MMKLGDKNGWRIEAFGEEDRQNGGGGGGGGVCLTLDRKLNATQGTPKTRGQASQHKMSVDIYRIYCTVLSVSERRTFSLYIYTPFLLSVNGCE
jgi:hypothetical protein